MAVPYAERHISDTAVSPALFRIGTTTPQLRPVTHRTRVDPTWGGGLLGFVSAAVLLTLLTTMQLGITGFTVSDPVAYLSFDFTTPKSTYQVGEPITFSIVPADASASIAYVREDGGIAMVKGTKFVPAAPGMYTFNALLHAHGLSERKIHTVTVTEPVIVI